MSDSTIESTLINQRGYPEDVVREAMIDPASLSYTEYVRRSQPRQPLPRWLVAIIAAVIVGLLSLIILFLI